MNKYCVHLSALCVVHGVRLLIDVTMPREHCYCETSSRVVVTPPVDDETQYAAVLHEFGHLCHTNPRPSSLQSHPRTIQEMRILLEEEDHAWDWARQHAGSEWTTGMEMVYQWARETYRKRLERMVKNSLGGSRAALSVKGWR